MYNPVTMDHFLNPRNPGPLTDADGMGQADNGKCGDLTRMWVKIAPDGTLSDVRFQAFGSGAAIAAASVTTVLSQGRPAAEALAIGAAEVEAAMDGLPPMKKNCAVMAAEALHRALAAAGVTE